MMGRDGTSMKDSLSLNIKALSAEYRAGRLAPVDVIREVYERIGRGIGKNSWTYIVPEAIACQQAEAIAKRDRDALPLFGIPFSVKDNIHVAGLPTTAGCPAFTHVPDTSATVVTKLVRAGAILIGKNTMDQFATGLVGVRSPVHPVNSFNSEYIPGGSSSGSAITVATGLVSFSLGSDTGGSGRVPAALNNIVGLKPTPGIVSAAGMVYANRTFDCVPIFGLTCDDVETVFEVLLGADPADPFMKDNPEFQEASVYPSHIRIGIPDAKHLTFFGDKNAEQAFVKALALARRLGAEVLEVDYSPFQDVGKMLFSGPVFAERVTSVGEFVIAHEPEVDKVVSEIFQSAPDYTAVEYINECYRLRELRRRAFDELQKVDVLMVPTTGTIYRIEDVKRDPVRLNVNMGYYTQFANLLGLCAIAIPSTLRDDGLPFGICFLARPRNDRALIQLGRIFHRAADLPLGATSRFIDGRIARAPAKSPSLSA